MAGVLFGLVGRFWTSVLPRTMRVRSCCTGRASGMVAINTNKKNPICVFSTSRKGYQCVCFTKKQTKVEEKDRSLQTCDNLSISGLLATWM